jgi:hypothetical protein
MHHHFSQFLLPKTLIPPKVGVCLLICFIFHKVSPASSLNVRFQRSGSSGKMNRINSKPSRVPIGKESTQDMIQPAIVVKQEDQTASFSITSSAGDHLTKFFDNFSSADPSTVSSFDSSSYFTPPLSPKDSFPFGLSLLVKKP